MKYQFKKHYTLEEARALLPQIREWLASLDSHRRQSEKCESRIQSLMAAGNDVGGETVNTWVRSLLAMQDVVSEFECRQILVKDLDRGLIDFPAIIGGKEVFLCWEKDEDDIEFWHDLDSGFAGREKL